jgi:hypothetical protein
MNIVLQRLAVLLIAAVMQRSFFVVLWPMIVAPGVIIALVISFVFILGFERGLVWSLFGVTLHALLGPMTLFPIYAVAIAYAMSFLSRRIVLEAHMRSYFILASVAGGFALMYAVGLALLQAEILSVGWLIANFFESFMLFLLLFPLLRFWEQRIQSSLMSEFRGVRI